VSENEPLPEPLKALEAELAGLKPHTGTLKRDALMYRAGQAAALTERASRRRGAWPGAFAAMTTVAATLAIVLAVRWQPRTVERIVYSPAEQTPELTEPSPRPDAPQPLPVEADTMPEPRPAAEALPSWVAALIGRRDITAGDDRESYRYLRSRIVDGDVDAIAVAHRKSPSSAVTYGQWMKQWQQSLD